MSNMFTIANSFRLTLHVIAFLCALARQAVNVANNGSSYLFYFGAQQRDASTEDVTSYESSGNFAFSLTILGAILVGLSLLVMVNVPLNGRRVAVLSAVLNGFAGLSFIISLGITSSNSKNYNEGIEASDIHHKDQSEFVLSRGSAVLAATIPLLMLSAFLMLAVFYFKFVQTKGIILPCQQNSGLWLETQTLSSPTSNATTAGNSTLEIERKPFASAPNSHQHGSDVVINNGGPVDEENADPSPFGLRAHFTNPPRVCYLFALFIQSLCGALAVAGSAAAPQQLQNQLSSISGGTMGAAWHYDRVSIDYSHDGARDLLGCDSGAQLLTIAGSLSLCGSLFAFLALMSSSLVTILKTPSIPPDVPASPAAALQQASQIKERHDTSYFIFPAICSGLAAALISAATAVLVTLSNDDCMSKQHFKVSSTIALASLAVPSALLCIIMTVTVHAKALSMLQVEIYGVDIVAVAIATSSAAREVGDTTSLMARHHQTSGVHHSHGQHLHQPQSAVNAIVTLSRESRRRPNTYFNRASSIDFGVN